MRDGEIAVYADRLNAAALESAARSGSAEDLLATHINRIGPGDYLALLAYVEMSDVHARPLQRIRHAVRDACGAATSVGFGPRFLHSTGQLYKGGPNTGVFVQITCDDNADLPVQGRGYSFGLVKAAQARGDYQVLSGRGRRLLRLHLASDVANGLNRIADLVERRVRHR